jgi:hypothetical protein
MVTETEVESLQEGAEEQNSLGILTTPEIKLPPRPPEVHQGKIVAVTLEQFDSGARAVKFSLESTNVVGFTTDLLAFIPDAAYKNPYITSEEIGKLPAPEGKKQTPKEQWGQAKQTIEQALRIAQAQGREIPRDGARPSSFEEYVALVDQVCADAEVVYRLAADKNPSDPKFARVLKVRSLYEPEAAENPKLFKGAIKRWEEQVTEQ